MILQKHIFQLIANVSEYINFYQNNLPTPHASIIFSESEYYYIDNIISFPSIFQGKPAIPGLEAVLRSHGLPGKRAWDYIFSALSLSFAHSLHIMIRFALTQKQQTASTKYLVYRVP